MAAREAPWVSELRRQARWSDVLLWLVWGATSLLALVLGYRVPRRRELRRRVWRWLDDDRPVIWVANHLTAVDGFIVHVALFTLARCLFSRHSRRRSPWTPVEATNFRSVSLRRLLSSRSGRADFLYRSRDDPRTSRLMRLGFYLFRVLPIQRFTDDVDSDEHPEAVFEKCVWLLRNGYDVLIFPEAARPLNGWLDPRSPKEFVGRLAAHVPRSPVLSLYVRGEGQRTLGILPRRGEKLRFETDFMEPEWSEETPPREISARIFERLAALQDAWFEAGGMPRNCAGEQVVDLGRVGEIDTARAKSAVAAARKALRSAEISSPDEQASHFEVDLFRRRVKHLPTMTEVAIAFVDKPDWLHCLAVLRGGALEQGSDPGDVVAQVEAVPDGTDPELYAGKLLLDLIAEMHEEIGAVDELEARSSAGGVIVSWRGEDQDWGASCSWSGRFAGCSFMVS